MNAPEPVQENLVQYMPFDSLRPSPTNPRQVLEHLNELADSIARVGILQPILVRPHPTEAGAWEIVSGHRRYAAAALAAEQLDKPKPDVPVRLVELNDEQVCEVQIVENLQRSDLSPLEEATGYERLTREFGQSPDDIAGRIGKSVSYVKKKLRLIDLGEEGRRALTAGQINESIALLIARVPPPLQPKAVRSVTEEDYRRDAKTESMSFRQAHRVISEQFTTDLRKAKWSLDDQTLVDGRPACNMCPMKSGNSPDEYPDISDERTCMDPTCFAAKRAAHESQLEAIALEKADVKLKAGAARAAIGWDGKLRPESGLVKLTDKPEGSTKTWNQLAKSAGIEVETIAVVDKERSKVLVAAKGDQLAKALQEAGVKVEAPKAAVPAFQNIREDAELAAKAKGWTSRNVSALQRMMTPDLNDVANIDAWARALFDLALDEVNAYNATEGLGRAGVEVPEGNYDERSDSLRAVVLPQGRDTHAVDFIRAAVVLLVAQHIEVDSYAVAYRLDELGGPTSPTGIAKALGIAVDTSPDPSDAAQASDQTAEPAAPAKGKRARKAKGTAVPAAEATPNEVGSADVENEGVSA
jgi:ParB/RepB/Spo0J family partition protein